MNNSLYKFLPKLELIVLSGLMIRIFFSFINSYIQVLPGGEMDALTYHKSAINFSLGQEYFMDTIGQGKIYVIILGTIYKLIPSGHELFAGGIVSAIVWFFSAIIFIKTLKIGKFDKKLISLSLIIYSFLPFGIILTSITIREPFQLLLINAVLYYLLIVFKYSKTQYIFNLLIVCTGLFFFHGFFFILIFFIFFILFFNVFLDNISSFFSNQKFILVILFVVIAYIYIPYYTEYYTYITNEIQNYKFNHEQEARALYKNQLEITYEKKYFLLSIFYSFIQFEFEPFPWRETIMKDNILILQNILKLFLFFLIFKKLIKSLHTKNLTYISILSIFLFMELLWSAGTVNWGTAVRHQIPGYGMLIFLSLVNLRKIK